MFAQWDQEIITECSSHNTEQQLMCAFKLTHVSSWPVAWPLPVSRWLVSSWSLCQRLWVHHNPHSRATKISMLAHMYNLPCCCFSIYFNNVIILHLPITCLLLWNHVKHYVIEILLIHFFLHQNKSKPTEMVTSSHGPSMI